MIRIEVDLQTGGQKVIEMTPEEEAEAEARSAAYAAEQAAIPQQTPVEKLVAFLAANPDVAAMIK